jgi:hypothetical protein
MHSAEIDSLLAIVRVFLSSPGDVHAERRRVDLVLSRLNTEFRGRVKFESVRWETRFYSSHDTFQPQIPEAATCDIVVAIFKARLGTPLPATFPHRLSTDEPYPSGSAYEVLSAIEKRRATGTLPDVYVFRYPHSPSVALDAADRADIEAQWQGLKNFFDRWFLRPGGEFISAFHEYSSVDDFAAKLDECLRQWLARHGHASAGTVWDRSVRGSPFPGLSAFDSDRRQVFFGRDLAINHALERLRAADARGTSFLLLIGASGAGKSSFLRAALFPSLVVPGQLDDVDGWRSVVFNAGADPFRLLAEGLLQDAALGCELRAGMFGTCDTLAAQLAGAPELALLPIADALHRAAELRQSEAQFETPPNLRIALAIDQAERFFGETDRTTLLGFAGLLMALVQSRLATLVIALRGDAYGLFQSVPALLQLREQGAMLDLVTPTSAELEEMIRRPVAACVPPLEFETQRSRSLATVLIEDCSSGDVLPLLQMTLSRLYEAEVKRGDGVLRFADYRGMDAAVSEAAEEAVAGLAPAVCAELPALVTGLVRDVVASPAAGAPTAIIGRLDCAAFIAGDPDRRALVEAFVAARLLALDGREPAATIRPVHESLLRNWPRARSIVEEAASLIRIRHTLEPLARAWADALPRERSGHLNIPAPLLDGALQLASRFSRDLPEQLRAFIKAAAASAAAARGAKLRRARLVACLAGLVAAVTSGLAYWAATASSEAHRRLYMVDSVLSSLVQVLPELTNPNRVVLKARQEVMDIVTKASAPGESSPVLKRSRARLLIELSEMPLFDSQVKADTLSRALADLESLRAADPNEPTLIFDKGHCLIDLAIVTAELKLMPLAADYYEQGIGLLNAMGRQASWRQSPDLLLLLGSAHANYGDLLMRRSREAAGDTSRQDSKAAAAEYDDASAAYAAYQAVQPAEPRGPAEQAWMLNKQADVAESRRDYATALRLYPAAEQALGRLGPRLWEQPIWPQRLGLIDMNIGIIDLWQLRIADAVREFDGASSIFQDLHLHVEPANLDAASDLGWSLDTTAFADYLCGLTATLGYCADDSLKALLWAKAIREELVRYSPNNRGFVRDLLHTLASIHAAHAATLQAAGDAFGAAGQIRLAADLTTEIAEQDPWEKLRLTLFLLGKARLDVGMARARDAYATLAQADIAAAGFQCATAASCESTQPLMRMVLDQLQAARRSAAAARPGEPPATQGSMP